ncbi:arginine-tRNA-protein transferase [Xylariaceae sp. FL0016]|nr:arginine-tRNA-protein transferase [Xylariaceae sp. FL0016]
MSEDRMQQIPEDAFGLSYISPIGCQKSVSCGYCGRGRVNGRPPKSRSYYARTTSMTAACYQALINRCFRRSGSLLYRPNQRDCCCPHYTIRLDSSQYKPSKDQRQTINRFNKHVIGDEYAREAARRYPKSREQARKRDAEFDLLARLHESESQSLKQPPEPAHAFTVTLESDDFTDEKYAVFENYQRIVHHESPEDITRAGFRRFLCSSPLKRETVRLSDGREKKLGSYHQCYRLDGKLVAIGVLDLLPDCVSAVYFLYHESIHKWSPGKLGALREIALAIEGGYRWWYPGFYIHTCPKMRYKIDYSPQQVLNPETFQWVDFGQHVLDKFDSDGYLHLSNPTRGRDEQQNSVPGPEPSDLEARQDAAMSATDDAQSDSSEDVSAFDRDFPGIVSRDDLQTFDFDDIPVRLNKGYLGAGDLFEWDDDDLTDRTSPKYAVAEMVATVGPDIMPMLCLDFRR